MAEQKKIKMTCTGANVGVRPDVDDGRSTNWSAWDSYTSGIYYVYQFGNSSYHPGDNKRVAYKFHVDVANLYTVSTLEFNIYAHLPKGSRSKPRLDLTARDYDFTTQSTGNYLGGGYKSKATPVSENLKYTFSLGDKGFSGSKDIYLEIWSNNDDSGSYVIIQDCYVYVDLNSTSLNVQCEDTSVKPNNTFTLSCSDREGETLTAVVKYNNTVLDTYTGINSDTYDISFKESYISTINARSGQFTVDVSDTLGRTGTARQSFQLENLSASTSAAYAETTKSITVSARDYRYSRPITYKVKYGSTLITEGGPTSNISFTLYPDASWFTQVNYQGPSLSVTVEIKDDLDRSTSVGFTVTAGPEMYPSIGDITLTNVPATNMPSGYGYVAGYSKVKISVSVTTPSIASSLSVVVSYAGASNQSMSYNSSTQKYEVTVGPITGNTTFTVTATDSNTRQAQRSKQLTGVTTLNALSIALNNYSVTAGNSVTATVSNNVGNYSYSLKKGSTTVGGDSGLSSGTFNFATSLSWFPTNGSVVQLTIKVVVTDVLGRTAENNLTVNLPPLTVSLDKATVYIDQTITVEVGGASGTTVNVVFKSNGYTLETPILSNNQATVTCLKSWFTKAHVTNKSFLDVDVTATRGSFTVTQSFKFSFRQLSMSADKSSVTAGQSIKYTFVNREGETLSFWYTYKGNSLFPPKTLNDNSITQDNPYTLFDDAQNKNEQSLSISAVVADSRGRSYSIPITINASDAMKPSITSVITSIVQPSHASQTFPNTYIANVSKAKISVAFSVNTQATITSASLKYGSMNISMRLDSITGKYEATTTNPLTGNTTFTVTLTDQRGMSAQQTYTLSNVQAYSQPKIDIQSYYRCNQNGTKNDVGEWCYLSIVYTFTSLNNQNARNTTVTLGSSTVTRQVTSEVEETYILPADMEHSYDIFVTAIDSITSVNKTVRLSTAGVIMDFLTGGKGIGLGKVAEYQNMVEINPDWEFKCRVRVNGTLVDLGTILESLLQQ